MGWYRTTLEFGHACIAATGTNPEDDRLDTVSRTKLSAFLTESGGNGIDEC